MASLAAFLVLYALARHYSGDGFRWRGFYICFVLTLFLGSFHMSTVQFGYDILFPELQPLLEDNVVVEWTAFIAIFLHLDCIPTQNEPMKWFSRR